MTSPLYRVRTIIGILLVLAACLVTSGQTAVAADLPIYTDTRAAGWEDWSWGSSINFSAPSPVHSGSNAIGVTYTTEGWGGLYLHSTQAIDLSGYEKLRFWIHGGSTGGQHLRIVANNSDSATIPVTATANSWVQVDVAFSDLGNPASLSDLYWQDTTGASQPVFYLDDISLIASSGPPPPVTGPALTINALSGRHAISDDIYGMNFADENLAAELRLPVNRRGGNSTTRYNWLNDTSNRGSDWYYENIPEDNANPITLPNGSSADHFVEQNRRTGTRSILTIPLIGWVAKQRPSGHPYDCGFKVSKYGPQDLVDEWELDCGNGVHNGVNITGNDPADTSVAASPTFIGNWINHLTGRYGTATNGGVTYYNLDNEPMLWNSSHRDVHPQPTTYDELLEKTLQYAPAIKAADPAAQTLGPVLWGWCAYFYSALDNCGAGTADYQAHGNTYFVPWYLQQMQNYHTANGVRILDYLDLHYYPQATGVTLANAGSAATQSLRLRSTRSLWDPAYVDESWISDTWSNTVRLIPRMREWVSANYPGTKLAITEYNWGGLESINGALAQADILGIFGREGLDLATIWGAPASTEPGAFAFRIFRNYDGAGHGFGETAIQADSGNQENLAVYAAQRTSDKALTVVVINKTATTLDSSVTLTGFPLPGSAAVYRYSAANLNSIEHVTDQPLGAGGFSGTFPASSITLFEIPPLKYPLEVTTTGSGSGTVTSVPAGISCHSGSSSGCNANFTSGDNVQLLATASTGSVFSTWGTDCSGSGECTTNMGQARSVSAVFTLAPYIRIGATSYATLQVAYNAAKSGDTIMLAEGSLGGSLTANRAIDIFIRGGFDVNFAASVSHTALQGNISLQQGSIRMGGIRIR